MGRAEGLVPFNPAAPEAYFRAHLDPLFEMGRALQTHPAPVPEEWTREVKNRADVLREKAIQVSNWTLAQALARSVLAWGARGGVRRQQSDLAGAIEDFSLESNYLPQPPLQSV